MKTLFRWAFRLLILLVVLFVAGILLVDPVAREMVEYKLSQRTGLEVKINAVRIGLLNPRFTVEGLVIYNRPEFGGSPLLDVPELHVEYDRHALWSRKIHLRLMRLNLAQISVIEGTNGNLNLRSVGKQLSRTGDTTSSSGHSSADYKFEGIDTLNLTTGSGYFKSLKNPAMNQTLTPHMTNEVYLKVNSWNPLLDLLLLRSGVNPLGKGSGRPDDHSDYWTEKLQHLGDK
jgi:uncharacterized protein involved in outer membrane biogenesis